MVIHVHGLKVLYSIIAVTRIRREGFSLLSSELIKALSYTINYHTSGNSDTSFKMQIFSLIPWLETSETYLISLIHITPLTL